MKVLFAAALGGAIGGVVSTVINGDPRLLLVWVYIGLIAAGMLTKEYQAK